MKSAIEQIDLRYWLALNLINPILGARRANQLLQHFYNPQDIFEAGSLAWQALGLSERACDALAKPDWQAVDATMSWLEEDNHGVLCRDAVEYPTSLAEIADSPFMLFYKGDPTLFERQQLAMVGSRNPTRSGYETAFDLAAGAAKLGFTITSGMALGIDSAAHQGALSVQGTTIAVAGTGLDVIYPAKNRDLESQIEASGLIVSEFPLGTKPLGRNFPLRNRIISGLSRGVVVVEAALKSGSLITAKQALEQGRDVFAIPGSIHNPTSRGCHWLLRQGAKLVENIGDILEEFDLRLTQSEFDYGVDGTHDTASPAEGLANLDVGYRKVLEAVDFDPTNVDQVIDRSGLTADVVCSMLLVLELQNFVHITSAGQYCRTRGSRDGVNDSVCGISYG